MYAAGIITRDLTWTVTTLRTRNSRTLKQETSSILTTRGIYAIDQARGYQSAYDDRSNLPREDTSTAESWWTYYAARPWLSGGFAWTGFDYRGE